MPRRLPVGEQTVIVKRLTLDVHEVAPILRCTVNDVRNMVRRGELSNVSSDRWRRLDPEQVVRIVEAKVAMGELPHLALVELARLISMPR